MSEKLDLEAALARLEKVVGRLERDELELEAALKLFDEGRSLIKVAERKLTETEGRLQQILVDREGRERRTDIDLDD